MENLLSPSPCPVSYFSQNNFQDRTFIRNNYTNAIIIRISPIIIANALAKILFSLDDLLLVNDEEGTAIGTEDKQTDGKLF